MQITYKTQRMKLPNVHMTFDTLKEKIKENFHDLSNQSITIRIENTLNFISTENRWAKQRIRDQSELIVFSQIAQSITEDSNISFPLTRCIFKILSIELKIIGIGLKISPDLCIFPKLIMKSRKFKKFCKYTTLEFFNDARGKFKSNGIFYELGDTSLELGFCLVEIEGECDAFKLQIYKYNGWLSGKLITIVKNTQFLEALEFSPTPVKEHFNIFRLNIQLEKLKLVSGGIAISLTGIFLGMFVVGNGHHCLSYFLILKELSKLFEETKDNELKTKLSKVNGLKIKISNQSKNIIQDISQVIIPALMITKFFHE